MSLYDDVEREARHDWLNERDILREPVDTGEWQTGVVCEACHGEGLADEATDCDACDGKGYLEPVDNR